MKTPMTPYTVLKASLLSATLLAAPAAMAEGNMAEKTMNIENRSAVRADTPLVGAKVDADVNVNTTTKAKMQDGAYVTLSGKVAKFTDGDDFELVQKNGGTIMIDTNDDAYDMFGDKEAKDVLPLNSQVTVTGQVDDNLFTEKEIDATSIRFKGKEYLSTFVSDEDKESMRNANATWANTTWSDADDKAFDDGKMRLTGTVVEVSDEDTFTLSYAKGNIEVDLNTDIEGEVAPVKVGDRVALYGEMDDNWFVDKHFEATSMTRITSGS